MSIVDQSVCNFCILHRCDRAGHFARDCPEQDFDDKENIGGGRRGKENMKERIVKDPRERDYGWGGGLKCYKCSRYGHFAKNCRDEEDDKCYRCLTNCGQIAR